MCNGSKQANLSLCRQCKEQEPGVIEAILYSYPALCQNESMNIEEAEEIS